MVGAPDYDVWLLRWPSGTAVSPHDHGDSLGAFTVVTGELTEVRWERARRRARRVRVGDVVGIERGVVHDVVATGTASSLSVHVYSPPLEAMGFYDDGGLRLIDRQSVDGTAGPLAPARSLHPSAR
jgi:quercetin dioxygenase-like cupin family protein